MTKRTIMGDIKFENDKDKFIIVRISSNQYDDINIPIDKQIDEIKKTYGIHNCQIIQFTGFSAYNKSYYSEQMDKIFNDKTIKNKEFFYYSIDRFSRNVSRGTQWLKLIEKHSNKIHFKLHDLEYPLDGNYQRIVNILVEAQEESNIKSRRAIESAKYRKENNIFKNNSGFGNNFDIKRIYEIKIILLIQKLLIAGKYPIHKQSIKDDMIDIVNHMPIQNSLKNKKILFIKKQRISIQSDEDELKFNLSYLQIANLFDNFAITFIKSNKDEGFLLSKTSKLVKKVTHDLNYFVLLNEKDFDYYPNEHIREVTVTSIANYLLHICDFSMDNQQLYHSDSKQLIQDIIELNKSKFPNLRALSKLSRKTYLLIPDELRIPDKYLWTWEHRLRKCEYKLIEDIIDNHSENLKKKGFKEKLNEYEFDNLSLSASSEESEFEIEVEDEDSEYEIEVEDSSSDISTELDDEISSGEDGCNIQEEITILEEDEDENQEVLTPKTKKLRKVFNEMCSKFGPEHKFTEMAYIKYLESIE